jgi:hypothetical protein
MFATRLLGPRKNAYFVTPAHGLFLMYRRENILIVQAFLQHIQQYSIYVL